MSEPHELVLRAGSLLAYPGSGVVTADAWIAVDDGRISGVGTGSPPAADVVHDHRADLVMPGLVNAHSHLIGGLVRGLGGDRATRIDATAERPSVTVRLRMDRSAAYAAARLAILELLLSGVTTTADSQVGLRGLEGQADGTLEALAESGMRAIYFRSSIDRTEFFPPSVHDDPRVASDELDRLVASHASDRITIGAEAMALHRVSEAMLDWLIELTAARSLPFGIHGPYSAEAARHSVDRFGSTVVGVLADRGGVNRRLLLYHPVHVSARDMDLLSRGDAGVVVCAVDNMLIGAAPAPLEAMIDLGLRVGIGTDQPNDGHDMFQLMKATILHQRAAQGSPGFGSPEQALDLASRGGSRALHLEHEVGAIEPGRMADLVAIDGTHPTTAPRRTIVSNLVLAGGPQAVRSVYVQGRRVVHEGRHVDWDHGAVVAAADEALERCLRGGD